MRHPSLPCSVAAGLAIAAFTLSSPTHLLGAERHEHKELTASSGGTLTFKTMVGAIEIKTHDQDVVTYDADLKPGGGVLGFGSSGDVDDVVFDYDSSGGDVKITMKWKDDKRPWNANLNAHHTLIVPSRYNVDVSTSGGGIKGEDINGKVAAHTSGGSIRFGKINGDIKARTSGGGIALDDVKGNADVGTSGGGISVGNVQGNVLANTSGGGIKVGAVSGEMKGHTSGGSIRAEVANQIEQPLELRTSGGSIQLTVPDDFKADLHASTSGGSVHCDLPLAGTVKKSTIKGTINGGGPKVTLSTSGGSIQVAKR
jgi:hypothetical protein